MASRAYIVSAFRTAAGKKNGKLSRWHPVDLGATVINAIVQNTKIDGALVDDGEWFVCLSPNVFCVDMRGHSVRTSACFVFVWRCLLCRSELPEQMLLD
jgi:hypothetical protein